MSDLGKESIETLNGFIEAFNVLKTTALECCRPERVEALRFAFLDPTTRAGQVKAHVMAMKGCLDAKTEKTLQQVREERQAAARVVPAFPDHPVAPPPPNFFEGVNA